MTRQLGKNIPTKCIIDEAFSKLSIAHKRNKAIKKFRNKRCMRIK